MRGSAKCANVCVALGYADNRYCVLLAKLPHCADKGHGAAHVFSLIEAFYMYHFLQ